MTETPSVLFVCLGNICRSPLAEAAMRLAASDAGVDIEVDSAGTSGWHVGEPPDDRAQATAMRHGTDIGGYRGRQVDREDFTRFTHIIALDRSNMAKLKALQPRGSTAKLSMLMDHVPGAGGRDVKDPYYGGASGFEDTWSDVTKGAEGLLQAIRSGE